MKKTPLLTLILAIILGCTNNSETVQDGDYNPISESVLIGFKKLENSTESIPTTLIEIDKLTGQENILSTISGINPVRSMVYDKANNQIFAISNKEDINGDYVSALVKMNLSDYSVNTYQLESAFYYNIILGNNNRLIAFKKQENTDFSIPTKLIELNKSNGEEIALSDINGIDPIRSIVYNENSNEIFAIANREDLNGDYVSKLVKVNLSNFSLNTFQLESVFYYNIILGNNNKLVAFKKQENTDFSIPTKLIELNKSNGQETVLSEINGIDPIRSTAYDENSNEIFAIANREDINGDYVSALIKVNLQNLTVNNYSLSNINYYNIVLKK